MTPGLFSAFDRIRIVNLASRTDRRAHMQRELDQVGLAGDHRVAFFPAIERTDPGPFRRAGSHGAFLSHLTLLEEAAAAHETILILQDDCRFFPDALAEYELPAKWDIFYGGYVASNPENLAQSDIIGAHFMGFSPRAARVSSEYLRRYLEPDFRPDPQAADQPGFDPSVRPPIDGAFVWLRRAHPELVTVFAMLGAQRASRTDIGNQRWFDGVPVLRTAAEAARALRAKLSAPASAMRARDIRFGAPED